MRLVIYKSIAHIRCAIYFNKLYLFFFFHIIRICFDHQQHYTGFIYQTFAGHAIRDNIDDDDDHGDDDDRNEQDDDGNDGNLSKVELKIKLKIPVVALPAIIKS